ncbi:MAG: hypothetical protein K2Y33_17915, partial [Mycolicibacterium frederiksbergense]|nr:hypothetical protein [Mycolicibacterium frederiksbergense]
MTVQPHTNNAQTWRDLADQLTPRQIRDLDHWERSTPGDCRDYLISEARDYIETNKRNAELSARIALPAGATADDWDSACLDGVPCRSLEWSRHDTAKVGVGVDGFQDANGEVSRRISIEREHVADDMVLAAGWERPEYADALVRVAELAAAFTGR